MSIALPEPERTSHADTRALLAQMPAIRDDLRRNRDDVGADMLRRQLEALARYVSDKDTRDGLRAEARRTEVLLGELLGTDVTERERTDVTVAHKPQSAVSRDDRKRFRQLARNADAVEELLARGVVTRSAILDRLGRLRPTPEPDAAPPLDTLGVFPVLLADPPWRYDHSTTRERHLANQYPTMTLDDLRAMVVPAAHDAVMFMWATSPKLVEALALLDAWGFGYRTCLVWVKDRIGMGYWARQQHELLLIGVRGHVPPPAADVRPSSVIHAPRGRHSEKPAAVHDLIDAMLPDVPKVELFARAARPGWSAWGNEAP